VQNCLPLPLSLDASVKWDTTQFFHVDHHGSLVLPTWTHVCTFYLLLLLEILIRQLPKNDRYRAKRDSIARAPREKRRGEATLVDTAGCMPYFCHPQNTTLMTHACTPSMDNTMESSCILHDTPILLLNANPHFIRLLLQSTHWPTQENGTAFTEKAGGLFRVLTFF